MFSKKCVSCDPPGPRIPVGKLAYSLLRGIHLGKSGRFIGRVPGQGMALAIAFSLMSSLTVSRPLPASPWRGQSTCPPAGAARRPCTVQHRSRRPSPRRRRARRVGAVTVPGGACRAARESGGEAIQGRSESRYRLQSLENARQAG